MFFMGHGVVAKV